jgi:hypothetical protein
MARFRQVAITWGWNLAGIKEWFSLRMAASDVQLLECTIFLWMTKPIYSFRVQLSLWLGGSEICTTAIHVVAGSHVLVMMLAVWHYLCKSACRLRMQRRLQLLPGNNLDEVESWIEITITRTRATTTHRGC